MPDKIVWCDVAKSMINKDDKRISGVLIDSITDIRKTKLGYKITIGVDFGIGEKIAHSLTRSVLGKGHDMFMTCAFMDVEAYLEHEKILKEQKAALTG